MRENIINSAVSLFATQGFHAASTRSIAQKAGVSEGLIFRHFKNKEGLLEKILEITIEKFKVLMKPIETLTHPNVILKHILTIPLNTSDDYKKYIKFIQGMRWQVNDERMNLFQIFYEKVFTSFKVLDYDDPETETQTFLMILEGAMSHALRQNTKMNLLILDNLLKKFNL